MDSTVAPEHPVVPSPDPPAVRRRSITRIVSGALIAAGMVALKLKALLFLALTKFRLLLVNPFEGFGAMQFAVAGVSMVVTIAAYATKAPLAFVVGFVLITLVHEIGHAVVIRSKGLRAGLIVFIPFVGGAVTLKDQPRSAYHDAQIGLAGPIAGTLASLIPLQIYKWSGDPLYLAISLAGFGLNLINLLPIGFFDGGRISAAVTKWMWVLGGAALGYKAYKQPNPLTIVVIVLVAFQVYASIVREKDDRQFYDATPSQRTAIGLAYFILVVFLAHQTYMTYSRLDALKKSSSAAENQRPLEDSGDALR